MSNKGFKKSIKRDSVRIDNPGIDDMYMLRWTTNNQVGNLSKWKEHMEAHAAYHYKELSKLFYSLLPKNDLVDFAVYTPQNGFSKKYIRFKNGSEIIFLSYEMGYEKFMKLLYNTEKATLSELVKLKMGL
jgi:hypothetical protein